MSFNIWRSGGRSLDQTIAAIAESRADLVGLQECSFDACRSIAKALGMHEVHDANGHVILSRAPLATIARTTDPWGGLGATTTLDGVRVNLFDVHLFWDEYGPYLLREGRTPAEVLARERTLRMPGLEEMLRALDPFVAAGEPTLLVGDFNAPSHLDYADMPWPESLACEAHGLVDAYRAVHPAVPTSDLPGAFAFDAPGITWSPLVAEEPRGAFDRIDFVHHGPELVPRTAEVLDERNSVAPWPSDHRAVVCTFALR